MTILFYILSYLILLVAFLYGWKKLMDWNKSRERWPVQPRPQLPDATEMMEKLLEFGVRKANGNQ